MSIAMSDEVVEELVDLRNKAIDDYVRGGVSRYDYRDELDAVAVELDRRLTPTALRVSRGTRARRVLRAILEESQRHEPAPEIVAAREVRRQARLRRIAREDPERYETELDRMRQDDELVRTSPPDEIRMLPPIVDALKRPVEAGHGAECLARVRERVVQPDPWLEPESSTVAYAFGDRLSWVELTDGVPCQCCGRQYRGHETEQRPGEPWAAYRARLEPVEVEYRSRHEGHGTSFTYGGSPIHCSRCCPPPPLSPEQIQNLRRILDRSEPAAAPRASQPVRQCGTCRQVLEDGHVCRLEDLPKKLQAVVNAVVAQERGRLIPE